MQEAPPPWTGHYNFLTSGLLRSGYVHVVNFDFVPKIELHSIYNEAWKFDQKLVKVFPSTLLWLISKRFFFIPPPRI